jgi:hypothetical protein
VHEASLPFGQPALPPGLGADHDPDQRDEQGTWRGRDDCQARRSVYLCRQGENVSGQASTAFGQHFNSIKLAVFHLFLAKYCIVFAVTNSTWRFLM